MQRQNYMNQNVSPPVWKVSNMLLRKSRGQLLIASERMKQLIQSRNDTQLCYGFSSSNVQMWELDHNEEWALNNWCFQTEGLEKTLESPLDSKEIKHNQTCQSKRKSTGNIHWKNWCWGWNSDTLATWCEELTHWKRLWCWEKLKAKKGTTEDEMVGGHHWLKGYEFEQTPWDSGGQRTRCATVHGVAKSQIWLSDWKATVHLVIWGISHRKDNFPLPQVQLFKSWSL